MGDVTIGLLHPGEMGAAVGQCLVGAGHTVLWVPEGRSAATRERAAAAGLDGCGWAEMAARSDVIVSVCPPASALDVARAVAGTGFGGLYLDANAISPATAREVAGIVTAGGPATWTAGSSGLPRSRRDSSGCIYRATGLERSGICSAAARSTRDWSRRRERRPR